MKILSRYMDWLHGRWPHGKVEKLPKVEDDFSTNIPGVYVVGDLTGIPLLKFALDSGVQAVQSIVQRSRTATADMDLVILGAGVAGVAAAVEARRHKLRFILVESTEMFSTVANFPKGKPIFTYPSAMQPKGTLQVTASVKEGLLEELRQQASDHQVHCCPGKAESIQRRGKILSVHVAGKKEPLLAANVIVAIGRSGSYRKLGIPGEELHHRVANRLHDPKDSTGKNILVIGGGDSAVETAIATAKAGAHVTLVYRKSQLTRPKPENVEALDELARSSPNVTLMLGTQVQRIENKKVVVLDNQGREQSIDNDLVYTMIGRQPPLDFFRRSGIRVVGEWSRQTWLGLGLILTMCVVLYHWKSSGTWIHDFFHTRKWFPFQFHAADPSTLWGAFRNAWRDPGFYYSMAYCLVVVVFGIRRIRRRRTRYITLQTCTLMAIQVVPLFFLPYLVLPWLGANGVFDAGVGHTIGDALFPNGSYWRAFGFILAWPLFIWNVFTDQPVWAWLTISLIQTFVIIPLIVYRWGKGAYCGWICSCGALAETLGDTQRHKMPHGEKWNWLNMLGQGILGFAFLLLSLRIVAWIGPDTWIGSGVARMYGTLLDGSVFSYKYLVDLWLAGILGVGLYFHLSGRVWCRFACPLAALMHIYARFSQFRILADKSKCISCNVCTSVCHQGIDVMGFANKGEPMADPQCVRCSACVQACPTGTLEFGRINPQSGMVLQRSVWTASPVRHSELSVEFATKSASKEDFS